MNVKMKIGTLTSEIYTSALTAKSSILVPDIGGQDGQVASDQDRSSAFGCGGIDIKGGGSSGPSDFGDLVSLMAILSLPFIMRRWRKFGRIFIFSSFRY